MEVTNLLPLHHKKKATAHLKGVTIDVVIYYEHGYYYLLQDKFSGASPCRTSDWRSFGKSYGWCVDEGSHSHMSRNSVTSIKFLDESENTNDYMDTDKKSKTKGVTLLSMTKFIKVSQDV